MYVDHSAIKVSSVEQAKSFYVDALGLTINRQFEDSDGSKDIFVGTDKGELLQLRYNPADTEVKHTGGLDHLGFAVNDVDTVFDQVVEETRCRVHREPSEGHRARIAFIEDPDGYRIEFLEH